MDRCKSDIGNVLEKVLEEHTTSKTFGSVWKEYSKRKKYIFGFKKVVAIPLIALLTIITVFTGGFAAYNIARNIDKTDYPFADDKRVVGKWESVDFVNDINDFTPGKKSWNGSLYLTSLAFINGGSMLSSFENYNLAPTTFSWTKDMVLNKQDKTASKYVIRDIDGISYMFFEWKSGDYIFRNMNPHYYVLRKVDGKDYSNFEVSRINKDKIDYPFVDDPLIKGKWESVDFVKNIDSFKPGQKRYLDDLFLIGLEFKEKGKLSALSANGRFSSSLLWTKGLVLNKNEETASKYEIKEINGAKYLFFEWKSGDYIYRNMKPGYYVLKKSN